MYITILQQDLEREQREWARLRHVALQAAAKSLRDPKGVRAIVEDVNAGEERSTPTLSLPSPDELAEQPRLGSSPGELPVIFRRPSDDGFRRPTVSRQASANSYLSLSGEGRSITRRSSSDLLSNTPAGLDNNAISSTGTPEDSSAHGTGGRSTPIFFPLSDVDEELGRNSTIKARKSQHSLRSVEAEERERHGWDREEAEDWQNTRAAKRVSLANVPHGHMRELSQRRREGREQENGPTDGGSDGEKES